MSSTEPTLAALQSDISALKQDMANLITHLRTGASQGAQAAADQLDEGACRLSRNAAAEGERAIKALGHTIEEQPMLALLVVLGVGYLGGRLLAR